MRRQVLTIATGKKVFVDMAANLARSFLYWNRGSDIVFQIATDQKQFIPGDLAGRVEIIEVIPGQYGDGFSPKINLDKIASGGKTLFIDSDCLIFGKLDTVFDHFDGKPVSVIGGYIAEGDWFGDVKQICKQFNVPHIPKFNGGIYYIEKSPEATSVYNTARELEKQYDQIGFVRLRGKPNDEVLVALAMQLHNQAPLPDDGTVLSDPQACPGGYDINVISGERWLFNPPKPSSLHRDWYPFEKVSPLVVHFLGYYTQHYPYRREVYRLGKALNDELNWFATFKGLLAIEYPTRLKNMVKNWGRPLYRLFFGIRGVKQTPR